MVPVKFIAVFLAVVSCQQFVASQRSPYAGSRSAGYRDKFIPNRTTSGNANTVETNEVNSRFGVANNGVQRPPGGGVQIVQGEASNIAITSRLGTTPPAAAASITTSTRLPYDALGDAQAVHFLQNLPLEQQPFWLANYQAIENHRNNPTVGNSNPVAPRSSFLG